MKKLFVTYKENNIVKKAELTEQKLSELQQKETVKEIIFYPSSLLMEQNYTFLTKGDFNQKKILHG